MRSIAEGRDVIFFRRRVGGGSGRFSSTLFVDMSVLQMLLLLCIVKGFLSWNEKKHDRLRLVSRTVQGYC